MKVEMKKIHETQWKKYLESFSKINSHKRTFKAMFNLFKHCFFFLVVLTIIWNEYTMWQAKFLNMDFCHKYYIFQW